MEKKGIELSGDRRQGYSGRMAREEYSWIHARACCDHVFNVIVPKESW
jgi:hypothetical protein